MFFSRTNVIVALVLVLFLAAHSAVAQSPQSRDVDWLDPVRELWREVTFYLDVLIDDSADDAAPDAISEGSLGWIDPSGTPGEAPGGASGGFSNGAAGDSDPGPSRQHGWIDPSGVSGSNGESR